ncbi:PQQ-dependent sugar dehydrogenase [Adhaeretor mobilis]|uniref:Quinoprotein glucose dehydrogenase B n=1 Tax=Adhaeretor mobilis TaxID=1930276 RepID=A0A517MXG1_9BACT|nr:PQQ-dependent sugar dehydrogenase [Adhaeretor mobilis]QDS99575.1 Quinoprotein glucose dehydrogenase B precursor [Adhaeretor mobilis]
MNTKYLLHCLTLVAVLVAAPQLALGQDVLGDTLPFSGASLHLKLYADPGSDGRLNSFTTQPTNTGNQNLFLVTQEGHVHEINDNGAGQGNSTEWFDYDDAIDVAVPGSNDAYKLSGSSGQNGLQGIAFHPEFATNGKFYSTAMVNAPSSNAGFNYLGNSIRGSGVNWEGVVAEWTYNSGSGQVDPNSYRELFRVQAPVNDHPLKLPAFDPYAESGDENYGLLFVAHGDANNQNGLNNAQDTMGALGKFLRINPLEDTANSNPYSVPGTNPFVNDPNTLDEIYTLGHRNPHTYSFAQDANGDSQIIVGEIGRNNIEEVNVLQAGGNYGWGPREGTFVHKQQNNSGGYGIGNDIELLPSDEWQNGYTFPSAQYDHVGMGVGGQAIAGGVVIDNGSDPALQGEYIFADFSTASGHAYQVSFDDLINAKTTLANGESPSLLTQAFVSRLMLTLDDDGDGDIDATADNFKSLFGEPRTDVRFGMGVNGEVYVSSKRTGNVYLVTNTTTIPEAPLLVLSVNGVTGATSIENRAAGEDTQLDGYLITSASDSLVPGNLNSFGSTFGPDWTLSNPGPNSLGELNLVGDSTIAGDSSVDLGAIYEFNPTEIGQAEPTLVFEYNVPGAGTRTGLVEFVGRRNNVVLLVDPETGEAAIQNQSIFDIEIDGYLVTSDSSALDPTGWESLETSEGNGWTESNPAATHIGELNLADTLALLGGSELISLGALFDFDGIGVDQDLEFEFHLAGGDTITGIVQYGALSLTSGDFNGDGDVDGVDFLTWQRDNLSASELSDWQSNYGQSASQAAAGTAVPEPTSLGLLLVALTSLACSQRRKGILRP